MRQDTTSSIKRRDERPPGKRPLSTIGTLRERHAGGDLTAEQFEHRVEQVAGAQTHADLVNQAEFTTDLSRGSNQSP
ncbi:MAG: DUF1707 domain protein of unknown function [uncultured archaeon A07HR60]|nr:MAG: DUF1707 domain protein of unknown function [uncultured archaeon A07HR60]